MFLRFNYKDIFKNNHVSISRAISLIENVEELKGKQKENVIQFGAQGLLSKKLATIKEISECMVQCLCKCILFVQK